MTSRSIRFSVPNVFLVIAWLAIMSFTAIDAAMADDFAEIEKTLE